jgi:thiol-disulfide isomerase/thioredoxin
MAIGLILPGVLAQESDIKKMSEIDLSQGIVILEFMSTTCQYCRQQIQELQKMQEQYGNDIRIISVDIAREPKELLLSYKKEVGAKWEFVIDDNGASFRYGPALGVPTTAVLKNGQKVYGHMGLIYAADLSG